MHVLRNFMHLLLGRADASSALVLVETLFRDTGWQFEQAGLYSSNVFLGGYRLFVHAQPNSPHIFLSVAAKLAVPPGALSREMLSELIARDLSCAVGTWRLVHADDGGRSFAVESFIHAAATSAALLRLTSEHLVAAAAAFDAKWGAKRED